MSLHTRTSSSPPHTKARGSFPSYPKKQHVPDDKVDWSVPYHEYHPPDFTDEKVLEKSGNIADPIDCREIQHIGSRVTYSTADHRFQREPAGTEKFNDYSEEGRPMNPRGRTGLRGRGKLYKWGPNQAADPIVTRSPSEDDTENIEVVVIRRGDNKVWALPGGMVDSNEDPVDTAKREFQEEAGNHQNDSKDKETFQKHINELFNNYFIGRVYRGYVDEGRNTDNSWMETTGFHWHIPSSKSDVYNIPLTSGDDATEVRWLNVNNCDEMQLLHGNHYEMIHKAVEQLKEKKKGRSANVGNS